MFRIPFYFLVQIGAGETYSIFVYSSSAFLTLLFLSAIVGALESVPLVCACVMFLFSDYAKLLTVICSLCKIMIFQS